VTSGHCDISSDDGSQEQVNNTLITITIACSNLWHFQPKYIVVSTVDLYTPHKKVCSGVYTYCINQIVARK
jgi:hypothetical protein